jgi:hypothetical protein
VQGFLVEALVLSVVGVGIVTWLGWQSEMRFGASTTDTLLLIAAGPMTALPLMWFAAAARRIRLGTLGLLQYIAPSGLFLTAILVFGEPLDGWGLATFVLIWLALAIYSAEALRLDRSAQRRPGARYRVRCGGRDGIAGTCFLRRSWKAGTMSSASLTTSMWTSRPARMNCSWRMWSIRVRNGSQ